MISRRLLRIKALMALYAFNRREDENLGQAETELMFSIGKSYELYHYLLLLVLDVSDIAAEKIDQALVQFGMPVGPLRLTDEVGIDIPYKVLSGLGIKQDTLKNIVESGRLGLKKSGKGMFLKDGSVDPEVLPLIVKREPKEMSASEIQMGLLTDLVKVGKDLLDRKIVEDPRMIDVGMIWGTGFPPDKGGPLKWSDLIGLSKNLFGKNFY